VVLFFCIRSRRTVLKLFIAIYYHLASMPITLNLTRELKNMNSRQKAKRNHIQRKRYNKITCPECGERGMHYLGVGETSVNFTKGFWTCDKFYDKETGRRLESNLAMHTFLGKNW